MTNVKLINTQELVAKLGSTRYAVDSVIKDLKLTPTYQMPQGKGKVDVWVEETVTPLVTDELRRREAAKVAPPAQSALPLQPTPDLKPLADEIDKVARRVDQSLDDMEKTHDELLTSVKKLTEQNVVLLRMFEDIRATTYAKVDALQATVDLLPDLVRVAVHADSVMEVVAAPAPVVPKVVNLPDHQPAPNKDRPKIAIVALLADQKRLIEKEFDKVFDLRIFDGSEARANGFHSRIAGCEIAFVMNNFVDRAIIDQMKKSGVRVVKVGGGLTRLRTELTNVFLNA